MVFALKIWRHYLYGVRCENFINQKRLKYIFTQKDFNIRSRRWLEFVKDYDYPTKANSFVEALSRKEEAKLMSIQTLHPKWQREINELEIELIVRSLENSTI